MESFWQDFRYGLRTLVKSPGFTMMAVLTLALGIGANTAIFSVVNAFLFRPLPVRNADRLTVLAAMDKGDPEPHNVSFPDWRDIRAQSDSFADVCGYTLDLVGLSTGGQADRILASYVTGNYFSMLGLQPELGRLIAPGEGEHPGKDPVVVLGYPYWQRRFGGDPAVIGSSVKINGQPFTVVGVAPKGFRGAFSLAEMQAYMPVSMYVAESTPEDRLSKRNAQLLHVLGMLKPGVSLSQAQASLRVVADRLGEEYPESDKGIQFVAYPEQLARPEPDAGQSTVLASVVFMGLVGLVLLVACINVANLLLVRASNRRREMAIRTALGAGRKRLIRQLLTESVTLAALGGAGGALLGTSATRLLQSLRILGDLPMRLDFSFDWRVFGYVVAVAFLVGVLAGLVPALRASRQNVQNALREGGRGVVEGSTRHRMRNVLVVAQVAGSLVVLVAAGLFARSLQEARGMDLGFQPGHLLNLNMDVSLEGYSQERGEAFFREVIRRVRAMPGVESASLAFSIPLGYYSNGASVVAEGQAPQPQSEQLRTRYNAVDSHYLETLSIPLLQGRDFTELDTSTTRQVAIVNQTLAQRLWPDQNPLGKRFRYGGAESAPVEVVGIVRTGKYGFLLEDPQPYFYLPLSQKYMPLRVLHVRTQGSSSALAPIVESQIHELDPDLPVFDVQTMEESLQTANGFFLLRMGAGFAVTLGSLGMLLAIVGIYGVVSSAASQRTHEIGIRMALGAQRWSILSLVMGQALILILAGVGIGLAASAALSRLVASMLFGISAVDPVTFGGVSLLLIAVAVLACYVPSRRATRIDPMVALRYE